MAQAFEDLTISGLAARAVVAPLERPVRTASGTIPAAPLVLIDIATDQGVVGRAYLFAYTRPALAPLRAMVAALEPLLAGRAAVPADRRRDLDRAFRLLGRQGLVGMAMAGIDMALWDALGRAAGLPVAGLLGGTTAPLPAYDSYGTVDPVADRGALERSLARGFRAIKIKIGEGDLAHDLATVAGVREIVGAETALMVDYNQSLGVAEATRRIDALARFDLAWVEEPVAAEDLAGHAAVRRSVRTPIQTGENWWFPADMAKAIAAGACDFAMPDLMKIGGISGWLSAMGQAEAASIPLSSHLFIEASAHVLAVTPTAHYLEVLDIAGAVLAERAAIVNGRVAPRGPGLGIDWDEAAVAKYAA
ncbi:MAG: mandelate racemase [Alphaproteobacteria bacterium]|nr:mandelate racemase [Alphaproteobacteria bacterium]